MRKIIYSYLLLAFVLLQSCAAYKASSAPNPDQDKRINARDYQITVHTAQSKRMGQFRLSSDYDLKLHADSATAYLPYYGHAQVAPMDAAAAAVEFSNLMMDYEQNRSKKGDAWEIKFSIKSEEHKPYQIYLQIYDNGRAYITVSSLDRDRISYEGEMVVSGSDKSEYRVLY